MKHLLVIGASGVLGHAAALHFLQKGFRVTAFARDEKKVSDLRQKGATIIQGDIMNPSGFKNVLNGVDIVLTAVHGMLGRGNNSSEKVDSLGHKLLIDAAKKAAVKHFIYTSIIGASPDNPFDFSRTKYEVEQYLIKSGLVYTILQPAAFMEWHAYRLLGKNLIEKGKTTILGKGQTPINFIAVKDVVGAIDKIIETNHYNNTIVELAGPENLTRNQVAKMFSQAMGRPCKVNHLPIGVIRFLSKVFQPFHPGIARIMKLSVLTEGVDQSLPEKDTVVKFGLEPTSMEAFIKGVN